LRIGCTVNQSFGQALSLPRPDISAFPLPPRSQLDPEVPAANSWRAFHACLETIVPSRLSDEEPTHTIPLIPGDTLRSYDAKDLTGTLPPEYEVVLKAAAEVVGVAEEEVAQVVEILERRLERVRKDRGETLVRGRRGSRSRSKSRTGRASSVGSVLRKRASVG
jgi:RNA polymerase I-specific transcription initiation factor RRN7